MEEVIQSQSGCDNFGNQLLAKFHTLTANSLLAMEGIGGTINEGNRSTSSISSSLL